MKSLMRYQLTEFDCVPTSFVNALCYLFPRSEIPPLVLQRIFLNCLDRATSRGGLCHGTSGSATNALVEWLNTYKTQKFRLNAEYCHGEDVDFHPGSRLVKRLTLGGVVLLSLTQSQSQEIKHCILAVKVDKDWIYCFDPYFRHKAQRSSDYERIDEQQDCPANLRIRLAWLCAGTKTGRFQLGAVKERTCVLLYRVGPKDAFKSIAEHALRSN